VSTRPKVEAPSESTRKTVTSLGSFLYAIEVLPLRTWSRSSRVATTTRSPGNWPSYISVVHEDQIASTCPNRHAWLSDSPRNSRFFPSRRFET